MIRDTALEPTKSGVIGLLAAALGIARHDETRIAKLASLRMAVRVDREGILERDYHTTSNVPTTTGSGHRTVLSERYYLADALFLVVLESEDPTTLKAIHKAIQQPHWPLFFGRRAFVPTRPLVTSGNNEEPHTGAGLSPHPIETVLSTHPWLETRPEVHDAEHRKPKPTPLRTVIECDPSTPEAELRHDQPISFAQGNRRYTARTVQTTWIELNEEPTNGKGTHVSKQTHRQPNLP